MKIEDYFALIKKTIESSAVVRLSNVTYEKRSTHIGIIGGTLHFADNTILDWREYVDVEIKEDRLMYTYHYMDSSKKIIFRYDNTGHHKKLGLSTYPHHKHLDLDENVVSSDPTDLATVLREIEQLVELD